MKHKFKGPLTVDGSVITHVIHWLPAQVSAVRKKAERARYRWNEEPPVSGYVTLVQENPHEFRAALEEVPKFSHGRVFLRDGRSFNFWGARMVDACPQIADCVESVHGLHAWFSDFTTDWDTLPRLLSLGLRRLKPAAFARIEPKFFANEAAAAAYKRRNIARAAKRVSVAK